jgi:hypothetical protein
VNESNKGAKIDRKGAKRDKKDHTSVVHKGPHLRGPNNKGTRNTPMHMLPRRFSPIQ